MLINSRGVVLHRAPFKESSVIVSVYTPQYGRSGFVVNGVRKAKSKMSMNWFDPGTLLDVIIYHNDKPGLKRFKSIDLALPTQGVNSDFTKQAVRMFCAELVYKTTTEGDANPALHSFLENAFELLEEPEVSLVDFPARFAVALTRFHGFWPENNFSPQTPYFDFVAARFIQTPSRATSSQVASTYLAQLLQQSFSSPLGYKSTRAQRSELLADMVSFYDAHLDKRIAINALEVLQATMDY